MNDTTMALKLKRSQANAETALFQTSSAGTPQRYVLRGGHSSSSPLPLAARRYVTSVYRNASYQYLEEDGIYYGEIPGLDGLYGTGKTEEEAASDLRAALEVWVKVRLSRQLPLPTILR